MNTYEIYPELKNKGIEYKEVPESDFKKEVVTAENGQEYTLLHYQKFPWIVVQVDTPSTTKEWRAHMNAAMTKGGHIAYISGRYDHIVFSCFGDKHIDITQENADEIACKIIAAIDDAARWWVKSLSPTLS